MGSFKRSSVECELVNLYQGLRLDEGKQAHDKPEPGFSLQGCRAGLCQAVISVTEACLRSEPVPIL